MNAVPEKTYTTREVARMLGVTVQTVQRWVDAGHLRAWKTAGGHRRLAVDSVQAFMRHSHAGTAAPDGPAPAAPVRTLVPAPAGGPLVLVVDDDDDDREIARRVIASACPGATVIEADNGFSGLVQLGRSPVDVLITDITMPHLDGVQMLRTILRDESLRHLRIAAMSSHTLDEIGRLGGLPPGVGFFPKPLRRDLLAAFLDPASRAGAARP